MAASAGCPGVVDAQNQGSATMPRWDITSAQHLVKSPPLPGMPSPPSDAGASELPESIAPTTSPPAPDPSEPAAPPACVVLSGKLAGCSFAPQAASMPRAAAHESPNTPQPGRTLAALF